MESFISLLKKFKLCLRVAAAVDVTTLRPSAKEVDRGDNASMSRFSKESEKKKTSSLYFIFSKVAK